MSRAERVEIVHFSDVLCVWAYVSQIRMDELRDHFAAEIDVDYRFVQVFGHARRKLEDAWRDRGGLSGYGEHVKQVAARFDHARVHPEVWTRTCPHSSMPAHLFLSAVKLLRPKDLPSDLPTPEAAFEKAAWAVRTAFFQDLADVSQQKDLFAVGERLGLPVARIEEVLATGAAHALLSEDLTMARDQGVRASPTLMFNEGRQTLTGNVGYRIIEANVRELLRNPADESSWC